MEVGETKWENYVNKPKIDRVVFVLELEQRLVSDIYFLESKGVLNEQKDDDQKSNKLKFLEPIIFYDKHIDINYKLNFIVYLVVSASISIFFDSTW